jgi:hypothetical protein
LRGEKQDVTGLPLVFLSSAAVVNAMDNTGKAIKPNICREDLFQTLPQRNTCVLHTL